MKEIEKEVVNIFVPRIKENPLELQRKIEKSGKRANFTFDLEEFRFHLQGSQTGRLR